MCKVVEHANNESVDCEFGGTIKFDDDDCVIVETNGYRAVEDVLLSSFLQSLLINVLLFISKKKIKIN